MQNSNINHQLFLSELLKMRIVIGYLGEKKQFSWWTSALFEPSSSFFLEPVFPKTSFLAQYMGVVEAARKLHDEHLSGGSYHIFRLPEVLEEDLYKLMLNKQENYVKFIQAIKCKEDALSVLEASAVPNQKVNEGPFLIEPLKDNKSVESLKQIAVVYFAAFKNNIKTFPYWTERL